MARLLLLGTALAQRPTPRWHGGVEVLAQDPPIFLLRNFMSSAEAERLMLDYDVELIPEFVSHANSSGSPVQDRCLQRFPASFCSSVPAEGDRCDFQTDARIFASQVMAKVHQRVGSTVGVPEENIEEAWLFNWDKKRRGQDLHLDNYHHFHFPVRIASVLVRLRDDPVGIAFPLANWSRAHALAEDEQLLDKLQQEGNELPWRGNGQGRSFKSLGDLDEAFQQVCSKAPLRLSQGDALLYYHLRPDGQVNMRSMHASCGTAMADTSKIFMAKFVRAGSLLSAHGSLRTPELLAEMRAWMDERQRSSGLDSAAIWLDGDDHGVQQSCQVRCHCVGPFELWAGAAAVGQRQLSPWFVRPSVALGAAPDLLCQVPEVFQERKPGEVFEIHILIGNTGERPWPAGTVLSLRDGDPMGGPAGLRLQEVPPGSTVPLALSLQAPLEGKAYSVWSLADGDRVPFGTLIWVDAAVEGPEARVQPGWEVEQAEPARSTAEGCEVFWSQPIFQELSSQTSALPTASSPDRGRPRLCWSLGHRFWFAELSFHHVKPPETFVFGFCVPAQCEGKEVDLQIAKPFLRRLSSSSSGSDWCRLELHEWTQELQGFLPLLPLVVLALWRGQKGDPQDLQLWPCLLRLLATACLAVYHFASFPVYAAPGLPAGLLHFVTFGFGILHDPLFTALSASLLLRGGPPSWNWRTMAGRLGRKWLRLAPVGVASRVLLCFALRRIPSVPFLLNVQPRLNARLCSWSEARTHHACTPQWGLVDALLAFPPLDFAGFFVEQDVVRSMLLALLALCLAGRWQLRMLGMGFLAATCWSLLRSMRDCVDDLGHVGGPCVPSPLTAYLDLPGDTAVALAVLLRHRFPLPMLPDVKGTCATLVAAVAMEVVGSPHPAAAGAWYLLSRVLLGLSAAGLCASPGKPAPRWLGHLSKLCFGVCALHVRALEVIFGYLRPTLSDFSWDLLLLDLAAMLLCSFALSAVLQLATWPFQAAWAKDMAHTQGSQLRLCCEKASRIGSGLSLRQDAFAGGKNGCDAVVGNAAKRSAMKREGLHFFAKPGAQTLGRFPDEARGVETVGLQVMTRGSLGAQAHHPELPMPRPGAPATISAQQELEILHIPNGNEELRQTAGSADIRAAFW
ncbi:unnamed protein product [Effrenium voratum]|uniref:Nbr1 FW domain-containing protein n=1 Tax=Effrenium voratum TaxID=2562239 RepID=A0AA36MQB9_9DINO|nr:unnamed protein product [Effrenium voratum]